MASNFACAACGLRPSCHLKTAAPLACSKRAPQGRCRGRRGRGRRLPGCTRRAHRPPPGGRPSPGPVWQLGRGGALGVGNGRIEPATLRKLRCTGTEAQPGNSSQGGRGATQAPYRRDDRRPHPAAQVLGAQHLLPVGWEQAPWTAALDGASPALACPRGRAEGGKEGGALAAPTLGPGPSCLCCW